MQVVSWRGRQDGRKAQHIKHLVVEVTLGVKSLKAFLIMFFCLIATVLFALRSLGMLKHLDGVHIDLHIRQQCVDLFSTNL